MGIYLNPDHWRNLWDLHRTETYEALWKYIEMNYDGMRDSVIQMLAGMTKWRQA